MRGPMARHVASELMRCGTSIGANAEEAQEGQTKPDYITKMAISRKESRESAYWLRMALAVEIVTKEEIAWELAEAGELKAMIIAAIKTAQSSPTRG
jgi:four helix bundle protein